MVVGGEVPNKGTIPFGWGEMKMKAKLFVFTALLMALSVAGFAQENNPAESADPRLDQKVTYQAKAEFLHKVLEELTGKTGVIMTCGKNNKDWQVRERKVNIFVKDMPLKDLQQHLATLLHFIWSKSVKDGVISYKLYQDSKAKKEEESLRVQTKEAAAKKQIEKRKKALDDLEKAAALSSEEAEKLRDKSPLQYLMAKEPVSSAMVKLLKTVPEARAALLEGVELRIPYSRLSLEGKSAVKEFIKSFFNFIRHIDPSEVTEEEFPDIPDIDDDYSLTISKGEVGEGYGDPFNGFILGVIGMGYAEMPLFDFDSPAAKIMGKALCNIYDGLSTSELEQEIMNKEIQQLVEKAADLPDAFEFETDDQDIQKVIKLELSNSLDVPSLLEEISEKAELQVIADHFDNSPAECYLPKTEGKLGEILKAAAIACKKKAKKTGKLLVLEDREWFEKRSWAVPEDWLMYWRKAARDDALQLDDIVDIACLTDGQIEHTIRHDEDLSYHSWTLIENKELLRLYAVLTASQKQALLTKEGLNLASLNDKQWAFFEYLASQSGVPLYHSYGQPMHMSLVLDADDNNRDYSFYLIGRNPNVGQEDEEEYIELRGWYIYLSMLDWEEELTPEEFDVDVSDDQYEPDIIE